MRVRFQGQTYDVVKRAGLDYVVATPDGRRLLDGRLCTVLTRRPAPDPPLEADPPLESDDEF